MRQSSTNRRLGEAIDTARAAMVSAPDANARFAALTATLGQIGFDQINYGFFDPEAARRDQAEVIFLSTMPESWLAHYHANAMHLTDPHVMKVLADNLTPYMWGETQMKALADARILHTARGIEEAGQRSAICTPLASPFAPAIPVAGMTMGSSMNERDLAGVTGDHAWRLGSLVHLFHHMSLGELHRRRIGIEPLTTRERDCLRYAADGLLQEAIAHQLNLARVTVETHLRNAKRKLRAKTLSQAVARAMAFGDIPPA